MTSDMALKNSLGDVSVNFSVDLMIKVNIFLSNRLWRYSRTNPFCSLFADSKGRAAFHQKIRIGGLFEKEHKDGYKINVGSF